MDAFLTQLLSMLGYQLPELLACIAGLAMLWTWTPAAVPGRAVALTGAAMLLASALLRLLISVVQAWTIHRADGDYGSLTSTFALFSAFSMLLGVLSAAGLVVLIWGACRSMQATRAH